MSHLAWTCSLPSQKKTLLNKFSHSREQAYPQKISKVFSHLYQHRGVTYYILFDKYSGAHRGVPIKLISLRLSRAKQRGLSASITFSRVSPIYWWTDWFGSDLALELRVGHSTQTKDYWLDRILNLIKLDSTQPREHPYYKLLIKLNSNTTLKNK